MSDWVRLRHPYQTYEMNERTMTVRAASYQRNANGGSMPTRQRAKLLTKTPAGVYRLKHSVNGVRSNFHPADIAACGLHGKAWPS